MKLKNYEAIGEQVYTETLSNGLNIFVVPKKGFSKNMHFLPQITAALTGVSK